MSSFQLDREKKIEQFFRRNGWLLVLATLSVAALLYFGIFWSMGLFDQGHYWAILLSGLFGHSFFVILMHDGAHKSLTRTKWDHVIMNVSAGLIILPVYTELFKKYHLLHHAHTNTDKDPLWNGFKERLFNERRVLYAILQCIPFAFNFYVVLQSRDKTVKLNSPAAKPNIYLILLSLIVAGTVIYFARPNVWFVLGSFAVMTTLGAIRYWGEHMGTSNEKESNTHWFPLGMGIGNHEVHHHQPGYSWLTLTIGLLFRKMDTNPLKSIKGIFFDRNFRHYKD
ncbi:MAG: fatty acid desaturase [Crocinitomix sp.]|jgi:fatty acid desaturase